MSDVFQRRDLLDQVSEANDIRPAVISSGVKSALVDLLAFRHDLIHGSIIAAPDGERLAELRSVVLDVVEALDDDLRRFDAYLDELVSGRDPT